MKLTRATWRDNACATWRDVASARDLARNRTEQ
jgi:hypothetical protein